MIGSYGPSADSYEKKFQSEEAPSGMLARGHYEAKVVSSFCVCSRRHVTYTSYLE